jgi:hypothetical protein
MNLGSSPLFKEKTTQPNRLDQRLILLTETFINKSALLKVDIAVPPDQEAIRLERTKKLTHELYKKFQIEVLQPSTQYLIKNNKAYFQMYDQQKQHDIDSTPLTEKIGINLTTET